MNRIAIRAQQLEVPACVLWPIPSTKILALPEQEPGYYDLPRIEAWQDGRCGICNGTESHRRLDLDHSYVTGLYRGYLCRGCNLKEGTTQWRPFRLWRAGWNPCMLLGVQVEKLNAYGHPVLSHEGWYLRLSPDERAARDAFDRAVTDRAMRRFDALMAETRRRMNVPGAPAGLPTLPVETSPTPAPPAP